MAVNSLYTCVQFVVQRIMRRKLLFIYLIINNKVNRAPDLENVFVSHSS